jgi:hypothetical protein
MKPTRMLPRKRIWVTRRVPVQDLIADLVEFFDAGGVIDASHEWVDKIIAAVQ